MKTFREFLNEKKINKELQQLEENLKDSIKNFSEFKSSLGDLNIEDLIRECKNFISQKKKLSVDKLTSLRDHCMTVLDEEIIKINDLLKQIKFKPLSDMKTILENLIVTIQHHYAEQKTILSKNK